MYNQFSELEIIKTFFVYRSINFEMECVAQMDCFSDEAACLGRYTFYNPYLRWAVVLW